MSLYLGGQMIEAFGGFKNMALKLQKRTVSPSESQQKVIFDEGFDGLEEVTVEAIQTEEKSVSSNGTYTPSAGKYFKKFIVSIPEKIFGTKTISQNGTYKATDDGFDGFSQVVVNVPEKEYKTQSKTVTPTESSQSVGPDSGFDGLSSVEVNPISSTYVGSGITRRSGSDLSASGKTVTVPSGYYASQQTKAVSDGSVTLATPTVNSNGLVTASATVNAGYISSSPSNKTLQLTTQAAKAVTPTKSSQTAVSKNVYTTGAVTVDPIPSEYIIPSGSETKTANGTYDVTNLAQLIVAVSGGGGLPAGISAFTFGKITIASAFTTTRQTFNHTLGVVPDLMMIWTPSNIATTYSMLAAIRGAQFGWRSSAYNNHMAYHGNSTTNVTWTNSNSTSYGISNMTATTFQLASSSSSYYWRAGTYNYIAIKFA